MNYRNTRFCENLNIAQFETEGQYNIPARDTQFDTRSHFNVDARKLGSNELRAVQSLIRQYDGGYDVTIADNGAYRKAIYVKRKK